MRKIFILLFVFMLTASQCFGIADWIRGDGTDVIKGTDNASDIDYDVTYYMQDPLDRILSDHVYGCALAYGSASTITVGIGEVVCSNGAGTIRRMRKNVAAYTLDMTAAGVGGIDSGSAEKVSTWYDVYAVADADATTFTAIMAEQGNALSDVTYYKYIGSVYNDSGSNLKNFTWSGNGPDALVMWDVPVAVVTAANSGWSAATSCATGMPSSSRMAVLGLYVADAGAANDAQVWVRPNGTTWSSQYEDSLYYYTNVAGSDARTASPGNMCAVDSSQRIQYNNSANTSSCRISVQGFILNR